MRAEKLPTTIFLGFGRQIRRSLPERQNRVPSGRAVPAGFIKEERSHRAPSKFWEISPDKSACAYRFCPADALLGNCSNSGVVGQKPGCGSLNQREAADESPSTVILGNDRTSTPAGPRPPYGADDERRRKNVETEGRPPARLPGESSASEICPAAAVNASTANCPT